MLTFRKDPESVDTAVHEVSVAHQSISIFIDLDLSHFKVILIFLRYDQGTNAAVPPKGRKDVLERKKKCKYYRVKGILKIVERKLKHVTELNGMD